MSTDTSVHLLPFNTKFRGTTNISDHFQPQPLDISQYTTKDNNNNDSNNNNALNLHMKINKAANQLPYEKDIYLAAPKPEEEEEKEKKDAAVQDDEENNNKKKKENSSLFLTHFRGRKLIGRSVQLLNNENEQENVPDYVGVVGLLPLQEEDEEAEIYVSSSSNNNNDNNVSSSTAPAVAATTASSSKDASFVPGWKKKKTTAAATAAASLPIESGARRQREEGEGRPTEPSTIDLSSSTNNAEDLKQQNQKNKTSNNNITNGRIPTARGLVPLETFSTFVVWEHDKVSTNTTSPALGVKLWFGVSEALHGY